MKKSKQQNPQSNNRFYRQGDVLLERVDFIPKEATRLPKKGPIVLALGEVTGHHHAILERDEVEAFSLGPDLYLDVQGASACLEHQEHAVVELPRGRYVRRQQREYSPETIRRVQD